MKKKEENSIVKSLWSINISPKTRLKVKDGEKVKAGDLLASLRKVFVKKLSFPDWLRRQRWRWETGALKKIGDLVGQGEPIFEIKARFGRKTTWTSPCDGQIVSVDENNGWLKMAVRRKTEELYAPVSGEIKISGQNKIQVVFHALKLEGQGRGGKGKWGGLKIMPAESHFSTIDSSLAGKVLVCEQLDGLFLEKCQALDVAGIVCLAGDENRKVKTLDLPLLFLRSAEGQKNLRIKLEPLQDTPCFLDASSGQLLVCINDHQ